MKIISRFSISANQWIPDNDQRVLHRKVISINLDENNSKYKNKDIRCAKKSWHDNRLLMDWNSEHWLQYWRLLIFLANISRINKFCHYPKLVLHSLIYNRLLLQVLKSYWSEPFKIWQKINFVFSFF